MLSMLLCAAMATLTPASIFESTPDSIQLQNFSGAPIFIVMGAQGESAAANFARLLRKHLDLGDADAVGAVYKPMGPAEKAIASLFASPAQPVITVSSQKDKEASVIIRLDSLDDIISYQHGRNHGIDWSMVFRGPAAALLMSALGTPNGSEALIAQREGLLRVSCWFTADTSPTCKILANL